MEQEYTGFTLTSVCPSVCRQSSGTFCKTTIDSVHLMLGIYPYMVWVSWALFIFVFIASTSALWWPDIWPKIGFPELKENIGSIHLIPGIYPYGVSLLTFINFRGPSVNFGPLVAKYFAENGVSGIKKNPAKPVAHLFVASHLPL